MNSIPLKKILKLFFYLYGIMINYFSLQLVLASIFSPEGILCTDNLLFINEGLNGWQDWVMAAGVLVKKALSPIFLICCSVI